MAVEFGKYVLHERIGTGGMAEVYRATAEGPGGFEKEFALKRILVQHDQDPDFVNMFIDEARIAVALSHPNVAQVFEFDQVDDTYYLAMEYVPGKDLQTVLKRSEKLGVPFTPDLALHTAMEVCKGLYAAHRATDTSGELLHVIHRDISPQNVQISFSGDVKILDFGVAKARDKLVKTQAGAIRGKLLYMPPEQVRAKAVDHRADIFSLGLVLYKALTGENPYQAPTEIQILERMAHCEIEPPSTVTPGLPEGIDEAVMRALAVSPDDRFPDAAAMHDALAEVLRRTYPGMSWSALGDHMHRLFQEEAELSDTHEALPASPPPTIVTPLPGVPATAPSALALGARMPEQEEGRTRSDAGGTLALPDPAEESADPSGVFGSAPGAQAAGSGAQAAGSGAQAAGSGGWAGRPASDTGSEASGEAIPAEDSAPLPVPDEEPTHRRRGHARRVVAALVRAHVAQGRRVFLMVFQTNQAAIRLYEGLGFVQLRPMFLMQCRLRN